MRRYELRFHNPAVPLQQAQFTPAPLGPRQVAIAIQAVSLNYRDLLAAQNTYFSPIPEGRVPCSDGAGTVVAVGAEVSQLAVGDRVATLFFPHWQSGPGTARGISDALGAESDGALTECFIAEESQLIPIPNSLSFEEAATLPCAAVTAWNALFHAGSLQPGQTVLLLGTGGVSIFALQFAKAAGARVIITSSDNAKLARARALGADFGINYRETPEWQTEVLAYTQGQGVDVVLEVGGPGTFERSLISLAPSGRIAYIGVLTGLAGQASPVMLIPRMATVHGIFVGSREMFSAMLQAMEHHQIRPVIDRTYGFDEAPDALECMRQGQHFGKIVIPLNR